MKLPIIQVCLLALETSLISRCSAKEVAMRYGEELEDKSLVQHLFVDFDGTIAVSEAFGTLVEAAYGSLNEDMAKEFTSWTEFTNAYYADYLNLTSANPPRTTVDKEIVYRSSPGLRKVESNSFERVQASGVFNYTQTSVLTSFAAAVEIRAGCAHWIRTVLRENLVKHNAALKAAGEKPLQRDLAEIVAIYCSEIVPEGVVRGNRFNFPTSLHTGGDKVELMKELVDNEMWKGGVVFIGDSADDLPPLWVEPTTIGIVAGVDAGMNKTLNKFAIEVKDLAKDIFEGSTRGRGFLYRAVDFNDVVRRGVLSPKRPRRGF
ncbi:hypothetical protein RUND412_003808 [Rhizina undulata]